MRCLAVLAAAMLLLGCSSASALTLQSCHVPNVKDALRCGTFVVPENRALKDGRLLSLEVVVVPSQTTPAKEPLFFLSGGPGEAATEEARGFAQLWIRKDRDIVLVNMRGTGKATRLDCDLGGSDADPQEYMEPLFHDGAAYGRCAKALSAKADLTQYTTTIAMRDLDDLRKALGYGKIDIFGGSYGTRAAIVYLRHYSQNVRAAILSGVSALSERGPLYHAQSAQRALDILAVQCAADAACHRAYPDVKGDLAAILATLRAKPAKVTLKHPATGKPFTATLTASGFADGLRVMLYDEQTGRGVPLLLKRARAGDYTPFAQIALENGRGLKRALAMGLLLSVTCTEDVSRIRPEEVAKETAGSFIGDWRVRGQMAACSAWPKGELPADYAAPFTSDVPVLLISGNLDPVTPPHWGVDAQKSFPDSLHVVMPGAHVSDNDCVDSLLKTFLATASVKALDTSCVAKTKLPPFEMAKKN